MRGSPLLPVIGLALAVASPASALARGHAKVARPVVVELFTAQGCADCIKGDATLAALADRKGVIALTWPVDYWDYEGWADTFAQPAFSERQRAYARKLKVREIYTPEIVVDGGGEASALDRSAVDALIRTPPHASPEPAPRLKLSASGDRVRISPPPGDRAHLRGEVWLVRFDPKLQTVKVRSGDNRGKTVVQKNVVRELTRLGNYAGAARTYAVPQAKQTGLNTVVLLQSPHGGRILAAVEAPASAAPEAPAQTD